MDYERAKRQMLSYLDDELFLGLESELEGIVDWDWLVKAVVDAGWSVDYKAAKRAYEDAPIPMRAEDFVRRIVDAALAGGPV